jgi:hypothetical protein
MSDDEPLRLPLEEFVTALPCKRATKIGEAEFERGTALVPDDSDTPHKEAF